MIQKVVLIFKTHFDIGFTDLSEKVRDFYAGPMLRDLLRTCVDTDGMGALRFVWTMPSMPLLDMLERSRDAERRGLEDMIRQKRIVWHALPFTSHTDFCGLEDLVQGFKYSRRLSERFGLPMPISAKMSDVPGHGLILPAILSQAGVCFLHLGCNEFARSPDLPPLFFWESPDGSRVLTMYYPHGYGSSVSPPEKWDFPVWPAFQHTHDNGGPQTAESIRAIVEEARTANPGAEIISGTMDDFYRELIKCDLSAVPVVRLDLADSWIHGVGSYPAEVASVRESRRRAAALQAALALTKNTSEAARQAIDKVYDRLVLFGEHTWGLDVKTWLKAEDRVYDKEAFLAAKNSEAYRYMEGSWEDQRRFAREAENLLHGIEEELAKSHTVSSFVNTGGSSFTGWASMRGDADAELNFFGKPHRFVRDIAALSSSNPKKANTYDTSALSVAESADEVTLENHRYRLSFHPANGRIGMVYDKKLAAPIMAARGEAGVFSYRYDKYGSADVEKYLTDYAQVPSDWGFSDNGRENYPECEHETFSPEFSGWSIEDFTLTMRYKGKQAEKYGDAESVTLYVTLPPSGDELFVEFCLNNKQETPFIESGSLVFPLAEDEPQYRINKNGLLLDPAKDIADNANHAFYCLEAFAAARQKTGVCVVAHDTPLMAIGETGVYTFRKKYERHQPELYFNLFNNMWGTNFPQWVGGDFRFRYTVFGFGQDEDITARALALYQGVSEYPVPESECPLLLPEGVEIIAFIPEKQGLTLRLRDVTGSRRTVTVTCKDSTWLLWESDLHNWPSGDAGKGALDVDLGGFAITTIILEKI